MKKPLDIVLAARESMPCPSIASDAWLLSVILELLAPFERDCMDVLLLGEPRDDWVSTPDLAGALGRTLEQMGAILSRLRKAGLVETTYEVTELGRTAQHRAVAWIIEAARQALEERRRAIQEALALVKEMT